MWTWKLKYNNYFIVISSPLFVGYYKSMLPPFCHIHTHDFFPLLKQKTCIDRYFSDVWAQSSGVQSNKKQLFNILVINTLFENLHFTSIMLELPTWWKCICYTLRMLMYRYPQLDCGLKIETKTHLGTIKSSILYHSN